jgi:lipopolysaccharide export system protein LptA
MRRIRRLFLFALPVLVGGVFGVYYFQRLKVSASAPVIPNTLPPEIRALHRDYVYFKGTRDCPELEVRAREAEGVEQPKAKFVLRGVEMKVFHSCGRKFDHILSSSAEFDEAEGRLFAEGEVDIMLAVPSEPEMQGRLVGIKTSGVLLDVRDGKARTTRHARFRYDLGDGEAVGAEYDPRARELVLQSNVRLHWRGAGKGRPIDIEAGQLRHKEEESKVYLSPWTRLKRDTLAMEAGDTIVSLDKGNIRTVDANSAKGVRDHEGRKLAFGANDLHMDMTEKSEIEKIVGKGQARLTATGPAAVTDIQAPEVHMVFDTAAKESTLRTALASGKTVVESKPVVKQGAIAPHTRVLRADGVSTTMRAGGQDIETIEVFTPGEIDMIPNHPTQAARWMAAGRMWFRYAEDNRLESMKAIKVATKTVRPERSGKAKVQVPALTWSDELLASFDPKSGEMRRMEQWDQFRYEEGERKATAGRAILESPSEVITLEKSARAWDPGGSVSADLILLDQKTGGYIANGNVASTRLPENAGKSPAPGTALLARDQPSQAKASRMTSIENNKRVIYEGDAVLWQAANRLQADRVEIDRTNRILLANGNVVSQFLDRQNPNQPRQSFTVVRSAAMSYRETERLAHYSGGSRLIRDGMDVKSREIRAWLTEEKPPGPGQSNAPAAPAAPGQSSLDRAFADGSVEIVHVQPDRTRRGLSEHAEYYVANERVVLNGGNPQLHDSLKGVSRGRQITYFAGKETLEVQGAQTQPVVTRIKRN